MSFFYIYHMKKYFYLSVFLSIFLNAQFSVKAYSSNDFIANEAYLYSLDGSKDILIDKASKKDNFWLFNIKKKYIGMMKIYFPEVNSSLTFISENENVELKFNSKKNKVQYVDYIDEKNKLFYDLQDQQKKREQILPALYQIKSYYKDNADFSSALDKEISNLEQDIIYNPDKNTFINYYQSNYKKFLSETVGKASPTNPEIINFLNTTNNYLETSSLLRPILISFLSNTNKESLPQNIEDLLNKVDIETPRGQTILSELIDIFDIYSLTDLKLKYLSTAKNLKCSINERLTNTIKSIQNTEIGVVFPNNKFIKPKNTTAKTLYDIKADKKIILFWASTCSHCEKEIPEILSKYNDLKAKNIEVIGLSLDTDINSYLEKIKLLPWINDSEIKGWYSSYVDTYNIHATPTFYILDSKNKIIANPDSFSEVLKFLQIK